MVFTSTLSRTVSTPPGPIPRLADQRRQVFYHLAEALCRWIAPILSFTAEEVWENLPGTRGASVSLSQWYDALPASRDAEEDAFWSEMMSVRQQVNKALELAREQGTLRDHSMRRLFSTPNRSWRSGRSLGEELRFALITLRRQLKNGNRHRKMRWKRREYR